MAPFAELDVFEPAQRAVRREFQERLDAMRSNILHAALRMDCPACNSPFNLSNGDHLGEHWAHQNGSDRLHSVAQALTALNAAKAAKDWDCAERLQHWLDVSAAPWLESRRQVIWHETTQFSGFLQNVLNRDRAIQPVDSSSVENFLEQGWTTAADTLPATHFSCNYMSEARMLLVSVTVPARNVALASTFSPMVILGAPAGREGSRSESALRIAYVNGLAELALSALFLLFELTANCNVETIVLNCMSDSIDGATGKTARACVLSVQTSREEFADLNLAHVDPTLCLRRLRAAVPRSNSETTAVRPIVEFDKIDSRLIEAENVLGLLDSRPNLMDLTPSEFESLIQNLFSAMGLDTHQTQASRDGGVDCIAYDSRPIFGGKIVIQAKRYKNIVGVSAVRDLYGTVLNEGAGKGILVTTSGYGRASYEFARDKPLELLEGSHLLHLLKEHTGLEARIIVPDTWVDPASDS